MLHLSRKIILAKLKIWCSKMQPLSGNQCPDPLTSLMNMLLVLRLADPLQVLLTFDKVQNPLHRSRETTSERPKVVWACSAFNILTWKRALRHYGVHFFDISTSKSAPSMVWFAHFDFQMCFVPLWRTLFRHLNFQKCSERGVLLAF